MHPAGGIGGAQGGTGAKSSARERLAVDTVPHFVAQRHPGIGGPTLGRRRLPSVRNRSSEQFRSRDIQGLEQGADEAKAVVGSRQKGSC